MTAACSRSTVEGGKPSAVGVRVQYNNGGCKVPRIAGAPVSQVFSSRWAPCYEAKNSSPMQHLNCEGTAGESPMAPDAGSIIIVNALIAALATTGDESFRFFDLPHDELRAILKRCGRPENVRQ